MLKKHKRVLILLIGLLYVYSVCPLLCAAFEQKFCHDAPRDRVHAETKIRLTCCRGMQTDTAGATENSSESDKTCCATHVAFVFPDDRPNTSEFRELVGRSIVSVLPISATLPVVSQESFNRVPPVLLIPTLFPDHSLTLRATLPVVSPFHPSF